jgi:hypothetical protein
VIGNDYLVLGTVEIKHFKSSLLAAFSMKQTLAHTADIKKYVDFNLDPGGYRHKDADPAKFILNAYDSAKKRKTAWTLAKPAAHS